jgi:hypothetical protein
MRWICAPMLALVMLCTRCIDCTAREESLRVLFVGNSLTYVGNLPGVFDALSAANGRPVSSDMIAAGGATLTHWVEDGSVSRALSRNKYSYVILQERGGDFACGFGPEVCVNARRSLDALAKLARAHHVTPLLLGTYQALPEASKEITDAESKAASTVGIDYVSISERLGVARDALPDEPWFAPDGMHPGSELTLMDALLLYERIQGRHPAAIAFKVASNGNKGGIEYGSAQVRHLIERLW